jgi:DNA-binding MarR family transcriptional regulator
MNESPNYALHKLVFALDRAADALMREEFNISHSRALVLVILLDKPGINQHQLAQMLGHTDPAVSALLRTLIIEGYVTTSVSPIHKRKKTVELTNKGSELARQAQKYLNQKFESLLQAAGVDGKLYGKLTQQLYASLTQKKD